MNQKNLFEHISHFLILCLAKNSRTPASGLEPTKVSTYTVFPLSFLSKNTAGIP